MFTHQDKTIMSDFVEIETSLGNILRASPGHYIWAVPQTSESEKAALHLPHNCTNPIELAGFKVSTTPVCKSVTKSITSVQNR